MKSLHRLNLGHARGSLKKDIFVKQRSIMVIKCTTRENHELALLFYEKLISLLGPSMNNARFHCN